VEQDQSVYVGVAGRWFSSRRAYRFRKCYTSSTGFLRYQHESAYLLAKGNVVHPAEPISDVIDFQYTGNKLHPTQKPVGALKPIISAFCAVEASFWTCLSVPVRHYGKRKGTVGAAIPSRVITPQVVPRGERLLCGDGRHRSRNRCSGGQAVLRPLVKLKKS
jgi:hypothetical protein